MNALAITVFLASLLGIATAQDHIGRILAIADTAAEHHIEAPARQQLILTVARALYRAGDFQAPSNLAEQVSQLHSQDEFRAFLEPLMERHDAAEEQGWAANFAAKSLIDSLPGECSTISAKDYAVQDQIAANRYVGIGIALSKSEKNTPTVSHIFPGGPFAKVSGQSGDQLWEIDGKDVRKVGLGAVIDLLRGPRGSTVSILVKPKRGKTKKVDVVRDVVPMKALDAVRYLDGGKVAYLGAQQLRASVAHELRSIEPELNEKDIRGVILDLRGTAQGRAHDVKLLADALLPGGVIGRVDDGKTEPIVHEASEDAILSQQLLAVLVDRNTTGSVEWLAAVLQHNERAIVVGNVTPGSPYAVEGFGIEGMDWVLKMPSAILGVGRDESLVHWRVLEDRKRTGGLRPWRQLTGERWGIEPDIWVGGDLMNEALRGGMDPGEIFIQQAQDELERRIARAAA